MATLTYASIDEDSKQHGESNDCAVKALAIVSGRSYSDIHARLAAYGRKPRGFTTMTAVCKVCVDIDIKLHNITSHRKRWGSVRSITSKLRSNRSYLVHTSRHILAVVNGNVEDWTDGRLNRVLNVWQIG